jgi:competence protein ComEA
MSFFKDYFRLNRREYLGFRLVLGLIIIAILARYVIIYFVPSQKSDFSKLNKLAEALEKSKQKGSFDELRVTDDTVLVENYAELEATKEKISLFLFDPNTANERQLAALGIPSKVVNHIIHYREKGGQFRKPEDLQKIYGLSVSDYKRLAPYIKISETFEKKPFDKLRVIAQSEGGVRLNLSKSKGENLKLDLNAADSAELVSVRGIGPVFASRIIKYRNRLGGFCRLEQLMEVYGIDSTRYPNLEKQLTISKPQVKININICDVNMLKNHPYFRYKLANAIIAYRQQHGDFKSPEDLKKIYLMDEVTYEKVMPYIEVSNR